MNDAELFDWAVQEIRNTYDELGYSLGWRFLYTPRSTLRSNCGLMVVGLNPAGNNYLEPTARSEAGNAFRPGIGIALASRIYPTRVCQLFQQLAPALGVPSWEELMDQTLTSNFCPFRAPDGLPKNHEREARDFSRRLWRRLCDRLQPHVIVCLGRKATKEFQRLNRDRPAVAVIGAPHPSRPGLSDQRWQEAAGVIVAQIQRLIGPVTGAPPTGHTLRGTVLRYDQPTTPVAEDDWGVLQ